ncbi:MAG: WXG100 family type VII secretion target [Lachnospiraceae bacterium]|nr:WXG100 family type VII secretion target [Lachnospiraceae bacterium]
MAELSSNFQLKVTPETLEQRANEAASKITRLKNYFTEIDAAISKTSGYWLGEAGELHRKIYQEKKEEIDAIIARLERHPVNLMQMAGVYREAEADNVEASSPLMSDIIV